MKQCLILFFVLVSLAYPLKQNNNAGGASLQFLALGKSARAVGFGEAYSAVGKEVVSIYYNPAGVYSELAWDFAVSYARLYGALNDQGANLFNFAAKRKAGNAGDFALAATMLMTGTQDRTIFTGGALQSDGSFRSINFEIIGNYSRYLGREELVLGANLKTAVESLGQTADGNKFVTPKFVADLGLLLNFGIFNPTLGGLQLGVSANQLGIPEKLGSSSYPLPFTIRSGLNYWLWINPDHQMSFAGEAEKAYGENFKFALAVKYRLKKIFSVSAGYKIGEGLYGVKAGMGLSYKTIGLDYSFDYVEYDIVNRVEITAGIKSRPKTITVDALYFAGQRAFGEKNYKLAEDYFKQALAIDPNFTDAKRRIKEITLIRKKAERLKTFEQAMQELE